MGEATQDILNGITCSICGQWMPEIEKYWKDKKKLDDFFENPPGYSRICPDCKKEKSND